MKSSGGVHPAAVRSAGIVAAAIALALAVMAMSQAPPADASTPVGGDAKVSGANVDSSAGYWSRQRMTAAVPALPPRLPERSFDLDSPLSPAGAGAAASAAPGDFLPVRTERFPLRVHGKVFLRVGGQDFSCSGTVVDSRGENLVFTAGHCVFDEDSGRYAEELVFVPAYRDGDAPFGIWPASAVFTTSRFVERGSLSHDIGVAVLENRIQRRLGARRIAFGLDPQRSFTIYGYPAEPDPPYDGESPVGCRTRTEGRDASQGNPAPIAAGPCRMRQGSSGGGWITGDGFINSVVSYGYCDEIPQSCGVTFGPYFSDQALDLYTFPAVGGSAAPRVRLESRPPRRLNGSRARFRFAGSGSTPVRFKCSLDGRAPFRCGRKTTIRRLGPGRHVLRVRAVDQTGKSSRNVAKSAFRVIRRGR